MGSETFILYRMSHWRYHLLYYEASHIKSTQCIVSDCYRNSASDQHYAGKGLLVHCLLRKHVFNWALCEIYQQSNIGNLFHKIHMLQRPDPICRIFFQRGYPGGGCKLAIICQTFDTAKGFIWL